MDAKLPSALSNKSEVVQEIYGWLLGHYAVRHLMFTAAQQAGISPLRLGFTGTLLRYPSRNWRLSRHSARGITFFFTKLIADILAEKIPPRIGRSNPRVVKKPRSKFSSKKPSHRGAGFIQEPLVFSITNTA